MTEHPRCTSGQRQGWDWRWAEMDPAQCGNRARWQTDEGRPLCGRHARAYEARQPLDTPGSSD